MLVHRIAADSLRYRWKEGRSYQGHAYEYLEPIVPRIPDFVLESSIYLYRSEADALAGTRGGASAFLVYLHPSDDFLRFLGWGHFYVVTARHVIGGGATWLRLNKRDGTVDVLEIPQHGWIRHPAGDDVTCAPMIPLEDNAHAVRGLPEDIFLTPEEVEVGIIGPGDEAFFVGRLRDADGGLRNQPSVRFGNLSMRPVPLYNSLAGIQQESFIVEARSIGGYSGSPVYVFSSGTVTKDGVIEPSEGGSRLFRLGIDWCHLNDWQ